jgi:hypothetical protein
VEECCRINLRSSQIAEFITREQNEVTFLHQTNEHIRKEEMCVKQLRRTLLSDESYHALMHPLLAQEQVEKDGLLVHFSASRIHHVESIADTEMTEVLMEVDLQYMYSIAVCLVAQEHAEKDVFRQAFQPHKSTMSSQLLTPR